MGFEMGKGKNNKIKLSNEKLTKLQFLSFQNAIRLHFDSILLYSNKSYPSALLLSITAIEELGKELIVDDVIWELEPDDKGSKEKLDFLKLIFSHQDKLLYFVGAIFDETKESFMVAIQNLKLFNRKLIATYVGFEKKGKNIDYMGKIKHPLLIKKNEVQKIISIVNDYLIDTCYLSINYDNDYEDYVQRDYYEDLIKKLLSTWIHRSRIYKCRFLKKCKIYSQVSY